MDEHRSVIDGVAFPSLPDAEGSALLAILFQLERSQWWTPEQLWQGQRAQLRRLLEHAARCVPFYWDRPHRRLAEPGELAYENWLTLPVLTRRHLQESGEALLATWLPPEHGALAETFTSGTTGRPVRVVHSQLWRLFWSAFTLRDHLWHGRDLAGKLAGIRESAPDKALYPEGSRAESWGSTSRSVFLTGPYVGLNVHTPVAQQAEWLARERPDYLLTHPTILRRLVAHCLANGIALAGLRQVETIAESVPANLRALCREAWGVPLIDLYSSREAGMIALQCPQQEHLHVQAEGILVEVLDDAGRPCSPGEVGRVVVTPLHNLAMPLLRYELGDYAEVGGACPCGRGLPVLRRILGRRQTLLRRRDGTTVWPLLSAADLRALTALAPIAEYQLAQTGYEHLELRVVGSRALDPAERRALAAWIERRFGPGFTARVSERTELPLGPGGKFKDVVCEFDASDA